MPLDTPPSHPLLARLPALGFGAAPVGNLYRALSDGEATAAIEAAVAAGITYFDTAPHYGFGLSEQRLGAALGDGPVIVSSKVGRRLEPIGAHERAALRFGFADAPDLTPVFDYSYDGVMRSHEESRARLGRRINILYTHDLGELTHAGDHEFYWQQFCEGGYRALLELKRTGAIDAIGLGVNETAVCERALNELQLDVLLLAGRYTLLEQGACHRLLPHCQRAGVSVVVGGPYNSGILARGVKGDGPFYYDYEPAPAAVIDRVRAIETVCDSFSVPLPAAALQFPLAHPAVVSVIAGFASADELAHARRWLQTPIPSAFWQALQEQGLIETIAPLPVRL
ncbi:aldo/keto reductase [Marinimicrobium alkaliphilum]|uniref:aldo/keto reductase n=1 Tax=Marinimicrobium alkaliphilum TaxID=2202654 RepID=UPI000DBA7454|nr:aldo/keto reductase [Marinimicrobium alkaliphilum]